MNTITRWICHSIAGLCFIFGAFLIIGQLLPINENRYYASLDDEKKLEYLLDTYYADINAYLGIASEDVLPKEQISTDAVLEEANYAGSYNILTHKLRIRTDVLQDLPWAIEVLAHETCHHKQALTYGDDMLDSYAQEYALYSNHSDISYEIECERNAQMYVASKGFFYYTGNGCNFIPFLTTYFKGVATRIGS